MDPRLKKITTRQLLHHTAGWELAQDVMFGGLQGSSTSPQIIAQSLNEGTVLIAVNWDPLKDSVYDILNNQALIMDPPLAKTFSRP